MQILAALTQSLEIRWPPVWGIDFRIILNFAALNFPGLPRMGCMSRNRCGARAPAAHALRRRHVAVALCTRTRA